MNYKKILNINTLISALLLILTVLFSTNFLGFPYFEGDEGIYVSRARAFIEQGKLSTDLYWYDHPPFGWIFLSPFIQINKIFDVFSSNLMAGRLIILFLNLASVYFLYYIAQIFTLKVKSKKSKYIVPIFTVILFISSPLQIYFGRRVLLDNILVFWVLFSLFCFLKIKRQNLSLILSGLFLAFAILTKENAVLYLVPFGTMLLLYKTKINIFKKIILWLIPLISVVGLYPLYALSKGELFLNNYFKIGGKPSLIATLVFQSQRNKSAVFDFVANPFWKYLKFWFDEDMVLIGLGFLIGFALLFYACFKRQKTSLVISLFCLVQLAFLARGGVVFEFYIIPCLPFLALGIVFFYNLFISKNIQKSPILILSLIITPFILLNLFSSLKIKGFNPISTQQTIAQIKTVEFLKKYTPKGSLVISDSFAKADFYNSNINLKSHLDVEYNGSLKKDLALKNKKLSYIVFTKQVDWDLNDKSYVTGLINNSFKIEDFKSQGWDIQIYQPY